MKQATFVYVVYIASTADRVWKALTEGEVTRQYWGYDNVSDWTVGSKWDHRASDGSQTLITGKVLEIKPPRRLVLSWTAPEDAGKSTKHSRVSFDLEPVAKMIRLTVTHEDLVDGSEMHRGIVEGWPRVLSSLKSFLETGKPLDTWAGAKD